jgi:hypothetical protein
MMISATFPNAPMTAIADRVPDRSENRDIRLEDFVRRIALG